jgi:drug/metabolite transporter (DMT)-like permease
MSNNKGIDNLNSKNNMGKERKLMFLLMSLLVCFWGIGFIFVVVALEVLDPASLVFYRYLSVFFLILLYKKVKIGGGFMRKKDIPIYLACAVFGDILFFYSEAFAIYYLPVSIVSIMLALVPILSVAIERGLYKRQTNAKIGIWIFVCIIGVAFTIGVDITAFLEGNIIGYLLALVAVVAWNSRNFIVASLHKRYDTVTLTLNLMFCVILILLPNAIRSVPDVSEITPTLVISVLFLGIVNSGYGFLVTIRALHVLGPTTTALFSNFLPVTATLFGFLILNQTISLAQIFGGIVVVLAGYVVIKEKGKLEQREENE